MVDGQELSESLMKAVNRKLRDPLAKSQRIIFCVKELQNITSALENAARHQIW